jgi:hypothetical protein
LNDSNAYGAAIIVKLELASSCRTTSIPGCNHVSGFDIGSFSFLSAYFRPSNDDISSLFHSAFQNLVSPFTVIAMDSVVCICPNIIFLVAEPHLVAETQTNPTPVFLSDRNVVC